MPKIKADNIKYELTKKEAKCSDVITALKPTTGTNAANNVPKTTCSVKDWIIILVSLVRRRQIGMVIEQVF